MKYKFTAFEDGNVLELLMERISGVGPNCFKKLIKEREVKVEGERISQNILIKKGDSVEVFVPAAMIKNQLDVVFEDENIIVVDKPPLSVVEGGLLELVRSRHPNAAAVHRLDANTRGLVVFACNKAAEEALITAFKLRQIDKKYRALIKGTVKDGIYNAHLFKDAKKSVCYISDTAKTGYRPITTAIQTIKSMGEISEVELSLITGRTHQLRAHLAHLGHPIVGDDKYGDRALNKKQAKKHQQLTATSMEFKNLNPPLQYLNGKKIVLDFSFD